MNHDGMQFVLTYESIKKFDNRLKAIETGVALLVARDAEVAALKAEIAQLVEAAKITAEEQAAMTARVAAAVVRSQALEDKLGAAIPNSPPPA